MCLINSDDAIVGNARQYFPNTGNGRILLHCGGGTSSVERRAAEGETIPHPEIADKVVGGREERKSDESLLCQRIL
jgi:hypothetical protein